jgi:small-conductance mechanosensitive channel
MSEVGWPLLFWIAGLVISLYIWSYLTRTFDKMKRQCGKYIDGSVASAIELAIKVGIVSILVLSGLYVLSLAWPEFKTSIWDPLIPYAIDLTIIVFIFLIARILVHFMRHIALMNRTCEPEEVDLKRKTLRTTSLVLSYVIYIIAMVVALLVILALIPDLDVVDSLSTFLNDHFALLITVIVIILAIYFIIKLVEEILEDYKYRTKRISPQVIDLFSTVIRYVLWTIALLTITYSMFSLLNLQDVGLLLIILVLTFIVITLILAYPTLSNIFSGLALMDAEIYELNDLIKVGELEGEVVQKNLVFTEVRMADGTFVNVPNSMMMQSRLANLSRTTPHRIVVQMEVGFLTPHAEVERLFLLAVANLEGIAKEPSPTLRAISISGNKVLYEMKVYTPQLKDVDRIRSDLIFGIQETFHSVGMQDPV